MANKVRLTICGSSYVISTNESEDYMQNLAERLNLDMNELMSSSNSVSITTAAIMTALNYRDELEKASGARIICAARSKTIWRMPPPPRWLPRSCAAKTPPCAKRWTTWHRRSLTSEA